MYDLGSSAGRARISGRRRAAGFFQMSDLKEVRDGVVVMDVGNCLGEKRGNADGIHPFSVGHGDGV